MIIACMKLRALGERVVGMMDGDGTHHPNQPFVVLRPATREEWLAQVARDGNTIPASQLAFVNAGRAFFYEVSID